MLLIPSKVIVIIESIMVDSEEISDGTPLACAASMGREEIVSYLLGQDVQVNGKGKVCAIRAFCYMCFGTYVFRKHH